jgi:hypothetical protein
MNQHVIRPRTIAKAAIPAKMTEENHTSFKQTAPRPVTHAIVVNITIATSAENKMVHAVPNVAQLKL